MKPGFALKLKKKKKKGEKLHLSINRRQSTGIDVKNSSKLRERDNTWLIVSLWELRDEI